MYKAVPLFYVLPINLILQVSETDKTDYGLFIY